MRTVTVDFVTVIEVTLPLWIKSKSKSMYSILIKASSIVKIGSHHISPRRANRLKGSLLWVDYHHVSILSCRRQKVNRIWKRDACRTDKHREKNSACAEFFFIRNISMRFLSGAEKNLRFSFIIKLAVYGSTTALNRLNIKVTYIQGGSVGVCR